MENLTTFRRKPWRLTALSPSNFRTRKASMPKTPSSLKPTIPKSWSIAWTPTSTPEAPTAWASLTTTPSPNPWILLQFKIWLCPSQSATNTHPSPSTETAMGWCSSSNWTLRKPLIRVPPCHSTIATRHTPLENVRKALHSTPSPASTSWWTKYSHSSFWSRRQQTHSLQRKRRKTSSIYWT